MDPEKEIFRRRKPVDTKLLQYGFVPQKDSLLYQTPILNGDFLVSVQVRNQKVFCSLTDQATGDEYLPIRIAGQNGAYVSKVREAYCAVLQDIAEQCFEETPFVNAQANRIADLVQQKYGNDLCHPFQEKERYAESGTFRNPRNGKWYGVIMYQPLSCLTRNEQDTEKLNFINLKVHPEEREALIQEEGIYSSWHMNHRCWVSVRLDDVLSDERIMELIAVSYDLVNQNGGRSQSPSAGPKKWILPSNPRYYDVVSEWKGRKNVTWKQYPNIETGDEIYLYVGAPYSAILYHCLVTRAHQPSPWPEYSAERLDLKILDRYDPSFLTLQKVLKPFGVTTVRGPRYMPAELEAYIQKAE